MSGGSGMQDRRDIFGLANGADFVPYTEAFLGVIWTDMRAPKCLCPFHDDKHPSFSVKAKLNRGKCFVCQDKMVSLVDFTAQVLGISPKAAAEKIVEDLGL